MYLKFWKSGSMKKDMKFGAAFTKKRWNSDAVLSNTGNPMG